MGNYSLQKYKGTATRHTCPKCGDRHSFVYYVDENNVPLHPSVGRCNHESGCAFISAIVAYQLITKLMVCQADIAIDTMGNPTALLALDHRSESPAVLEQDHLLSLS